MVFKNTDDLGSELLSQPNLDKYLKSNQTSFFDWDVSELLSRLYEQKNISKASLARCANISEVYLHQVFSGRRIPSRDRLLCICIGLQASSEETQTLLKQAGYAQLYLRHKRDAIIYYGLIHHLSLPEINDQLIFHEEKALI